MLIKIISFLFLLNFATIVNGNLLPANDAFKLSSIVKNDNIILNWDIADGYYLYKEKIKISTNIIEPLGRIVFPIANIKDDEFFGRVGIYRDKVSLVIPANNIKTKQFNLSVSYQGCADIGVCYPPITKNIKISLAKTNNNQNSLADSVIDTASNIVEKIANNSTGFLQKFINPAQEEHPLNPDLAFKFSIIAKDDKTLLAKWDIHKDYYLYDNKFKFSIKGADYIDILIPDGKIKKDEFFGSIETHKGYLEILLPLKNITTANITSKISYQGCWEGGVCYPLQTKTTKLLLPSNSNSGAKNTQLENNNTPVNTTKETAKNTSYISPKSDLAVGDLFKQSNLLLILLSFFGFGLLLSFTPCIFPMIPILSGIIAGKGESISTKRAFIMSLVFVLAMSATYAVAGVLAGYFGENLQIVLQNKWVIITFSSVFVILAFSMFGYFDIKMPSYFTNKVSNISNKQKSNLLGVAVMGVLSALIVGPCVAPPLAGALLYIGQTGDLVLGGLSLFFMGIGMGVPLLIIGASAGKLLPKAGSWMDKVKAVFGIMMLAVAIYLLDRIIPNIASLFLWASLFTISTGALGLFKPLSKDSSPWHGIFKTIGAIIFIYGILLFLLVAKGGGNILQPLASFSINSNQQASNKLKFTYVKNLAQLDAVLLSAKEQDKVVMLDFYADWCISCKEIENWTFTDKDVINSLANAITIKADVTENNNDDKQLMAKFNIIGPPALLFFKDNVELRNNRIVGEIGAKDFIENMANINQSY